MVKRSATRVVAVTGGMASGKTTVVREFKRLGARVIDADRISRSVCVPGAPAWEKIVKVFGRGILNADRTIDRKKLGADVFADASRRKALERATHPAITAEIRRLLSEMKGDGLVVLDVPLLYEAGLERLAEKTIVVWVPRSIQIERARKRDKLGQRDINRRLKAQWPLAKKRALADFVIDNTGGVAGTRKEVRKLWRVLTKTFKYV